MKRDFGGTLSDTWIACGFRKFKISAGSDFLITTLQGRFSEQEIEQHGCSQVLIGQF